jgi:hypothetical protein
VVGRADATLAEARRAIGLLDLSASSTTA